MLLTHTLCFHFGVQYFLYRIPEQVGVQRTMIRVTSPRYTVLLAYFQANNENKSFLSKCAIRLITPTITSTSLLLLCLLLPQPLPQLPTLFVMASPLLACSWL